MAFIYLDTEIEEGSAVICNDCEFLFHQEILTPNMPEPDTIYFVRQISTPVTEGSPIIVLLKEIVNKRIKIWKEGECIEAEAGFQITRFSHVAYSDELDAAVECIQELVNS
jgi:hypothetical protein